MTTPAPRRRLRQAAWAVPVAVSVAVAGGVAATGALTGSASADAHPELPAVSAAQLLAAVGQSDTRALSGTVVQTARLGLPELPGADRSASLDWQSLATGSHTARVWLDGPDRQRVALLGQLAESDVVRSGRDVWTYGSRDRTVTHTVLPERTGTQAEPDAGALTPAAAADKALAAVDPSTAVTVEKTSVVADRPVYTLVLTPRDTRSTVRRVALSLDAETSVPLRVQVFGASAQPAFETGFTDVSFARPAASVFRFTPPEGAAVTQRELTAPQHDGSQQPAEEPSGARVVGTGWTSVLVLPAGSASAVTGSSGALLDRLTTTLPDGSRLVRSALVNVLLPADGRVLVGAVGPELLQQAAAQ